jgi:L-fuculose-phosphate aldolase
VSEDRELRREIVEICRRMYEREYIVAGEGNVSARLDQERLLVTPAGFNKGLLAPEMLVITDLSGHKLAGEHEASTEVRMHLRAYARRPGVRAVVHGHPPIATAFAASGLALVEPVLPEIIQTLGVIPLVPYGTPGTEELPDELEPWLDEHDAFLLENHGVMTVGTSVTGAFDALEVVEKYAKITLTARQLGGPRPLSPNRVAALGQAAEAIAGRPGR